MIDFSEVDIQHVDLSGMDVEGKTTLKEGWHKLYLSRIGEESVTKSGKANGATFEFTTTNDDVTPGVSFTRWFCTKALDPKLVWSQRVFESIVVRIAQVIGLERIMNITDLGGQPFYAYITAKDETYDAIDKTTGEVVKKSVTRNDFGKGKVTEQILSCKDFSERFQAPQFDGEFAKA